ncbi:MMPL family transporter [Cellulomonas humilata]|uniref:RND superfamily putative drug exporter n=1 Tax=Cellulomonas humilata TaxID=144055 RepID=A0ABU0EEA9_9CELL|nr:MMPL family transporter [Cellulomonas humilata]MDQ0373606.1 RND superfamily putative drug exporter [Cellulomonas humilata]
MLSNRRSTVLRAVLVGVALVVWLGIGSAGGMAQGKLSQVQTNDASAFLPSSAESTQAAEESKGFVDTETLPALVVLQPADGSGVTPEQLAAVEDWAQAVPDMALPPGNDGTWSEYLVGEVAVVPSQDGEAVLVAFSLDGAKAEDLLADEEGVTDSFVVALRDSLETELGATATSAGELGLQAWVTGPAGFVADLVTAFGGIDGVLLLVALGAVLLILVLVYRSPFLPFVVILTAVFALCLAGLVIYNLAANGTLVLNGQSQGILSILVVGASVDYALLLVARYREELARVEHPAAAMRRALRACVEPIAASAGTVIAGVLCLLLSDLGSNRSLGPVAAIGIASALLGALTLLPALLLVFGRHSRILFWPRAPRPTPVVATTAEHAHVDTAIEPDPADGPGLWPRLARFVGRKARPVWIVTALALGVGAAFLPTLNASGTNQVDIFLTDVDAVAGEEVLVEHFPAGSVQPAIVIVDEADVDAVTTAAEGVDGVESVTPYTGAPAGAGAPTDGAAPIVVNDRVRLDVATTASADTQDAVATVDDLRTAVHEVSPTALVGGASAETLDTNRASERDLRVIVPVVLLVIGVILMFLLRSVAAAALLLAANVLSFAAALGVSAIVFNHVLGFAGADPVVPLFAFVFLVALGVDYSIFLMTRVREESLKVGTRAGVVRGLAVTGGVITSAGIVLATTFAALGVIPLLFLAQIAFIVAFGVLLDTFVVRSLLVPALVHDLGRRTWWPSALSRHQEHGLHKVTPDLE